MDDRDRKVDFYDFTEFLPEKKQENSLNSKKRLAFITLLYYNTLLEKVAYRKECSSPNEQFKRKQNGHHARW